MILADDLFTLPFGGFDLNRAAELRKDADRLADLWADAKSRLLLVRNHHEVAIDQQNKIDWLSCRLVGNYVPESSIFLGLDVDGQALFAQSADSSPADVLANIEEPAFASLRDVALGLDPVDQSAAALAVALVTWHARSSFCSNCGSSTTISEAGHVRSCSNCQHSIFPRSDAAVIMLVSDGDYCVLGRRIGSALNRWSTLAGFVEAGESPEAALRREVYEEVGLYVDQLRYRGSQPWPFPSSLMLAYEAHAPFGELAVNEEHTEVRWFHRDEVRSSLSSGSMAVPSGLSAGGHLISNWIKTGEE